MDPLLKDILFVVFAVIGLLLSVAAIIYAAGKLVASFATKEEVKVSVEALRTSITDRSKESVQEHKIFAHKSDLTKLEQDIKGDIQEMRDDFKERMERLDNKQDRMMDTLTKLEHYTKANATRRPDG
jgi:gas vesicle protein